jgi:hypothetical protein
MTFPPYPPFVGEFDEADFDAEMAAYDAHEDATRAYFAEHIAPRKAVVWQQANGNIVLLARDPQASGKWRTTTFDTQGWPVGHSGNEEHFTAFKEMVGPRPTGKWVADIPCPPRQEGSTESLLERYVQMVTHGGEELRARAHEIYLELTLFRYVSWGTIYDAAS